ncbi:MAG TPA: CPBP family intramembrane glutamic endopeptidase [Vicinamibacteria bacterium]|nr:CPBP family intramembrane glutamic endopeptidase [Vicinamibacteria bacterium]
MWFSAAILATILTYTWLLEPRLPRALVAVPSGIVLALGLWHVLRTREGGLAAAALWPGLRAAALFTLPAALALLAAGAARGTLHGRRDSLAGFALLVAWGGAQQWVLQTVVLREAQRATSRRGGVLWAALLFAAVHLPNPFLTAMTFAGALAWCAIYDRHPNVVPLALSHAIVTLAILHAFDDSLTGRLRIGHAYLRLEP